LLAQARRIEASLKPALEALKAKHPVIADVRGMGAMLAIEFINPATGKPAPEVAKALQAYSLSEGILILTAGSNGNVLRFLPALVITDAQLHEAVAVMDAALDSL